MNSEEEYSESNNDTILCAFRHTVSGSVTKFLAVTVCVQFLAFEVTTGSWNHHLSQNTNNTPRSLAIAWG